MRPGALLLCAASIGLACSDPYDGWPAEGETFPYRYTPEADVQPWELARWETETFTLDDAERLGQYLYKALEHKRGAPLESLQHFAPMAGRIPSLGRGLRLSSAGDLMWIGGNWQSFAAPAAGLLDGDLRVANLETPTSSQHPTEQWALGINTFNAPVQVLERLPFEVLQLNNNHSLDAGEAGLESTVAEVKSHGLRPVGVDAQLLLEVNGRHWGFENEYYPEPHFLVLARRMIAAGADLVVGHGPHVVQPAEICQVNRPEAVPGVDPRAREAADDHVRLAMSNSVPFEIEPGLVLRVAPLHVLLVLKMAAYVERPAGREKDLGDIAVIVEGYVDEERRFSDEVIDLGLPYPDVSPHLLGVDLARLVNSEEREAIRSFLAMVFRAAWSSATASQVDTRSC